MTSPGPVVGTYDRIEVRGSSVLHCGREVNITWINQYAFYFKWGEGNEQIWIYDTNRNCLHQICNSLQPNILQTGNNKHTAVGRGPIFLPRRNLGNYNQTVVLNDKVQHCSQNREITWINPLAFYFKWDDKNQQIWLYDATINGYLQLGTWKNSVKDAYAQNKNSIHKKV